MKACYMAFAVAATVLLAGCADSSGPSTQKDDQLINALIQMGFRPEDIVDAGDRFAIQGDMLFDKAELRLSLSPSSSTKTNGQRSAPTGAKKQWISPNGAAYPQCTHPPGEGCGQSPQRFWVDLSAIGDHPTWATAVRDAMTQWRNIPEAGIVFEEGTGGPTLQVVSGSCGAGIACTNLPVSGKIGSRMIISPLMDNYGELQKLYIAVHELGHAIGLIHSDWTFWGENWPGARRVRWTEDYDSESVMNKDMANRAFYGFSQQDRRAANEIQWRTFTGTYSESGPSASWPAQPEMLYYHVRYFYRWYSYDEWGFVQEHWEYVVLAENTNATSISLPPADPQDGSCGRQVQISAMYPLNSQAIGTIDVISTCQEAMP